MVLTRNFKETVQARALKDPAFRLALFEESVNEFLSGDLDTAKALLRDYVNASVSFEVLAKKTNIMDKSLQRMLSSRGNPTISNFCAVLQAIQQIEDVEVGVKICQRIKPLRRSEAKQLKLPSTSKKIAAKAAGTKASNLLKK